MPNKTQQITERSERLKQLKEYFLNNLIEEGETQFNDDVIDALNVLEGEYCDPGIERIIGIHTGCGGKVIEKGQCRWCDKCKQYFCGCACG